MMHLILQKVVRVTLPPLAFPLGLALYGARSLGMVPKDPERYEQFAPGFYATHRKAGNLAAHLLGAPATLLGWLVATVRRCRLTSG